MPRVHNKKIIIQSARHIIRKGDSACHISKNAQSAGLGGIPKQTKFTRTESDKKNLQGENQK